MKKKVVTKMSILILVFLLSTCLGQDNKINKQSSNNITTEMEVAHYIYKNYNSLDFEEDREELFLWDLKNIEIKKKIQIDYKDDKHLDSKLIKLEKFRQSFYQYSIQNIDDDYKNYKYLDGPFFDYLVLKKDIHTKGLIWKIIKNTSIDIDKRKEMLGKLIQYEDNKFIIKDSDGHSNLREQSNANSTIVEKIKSDEEISVRNEDNIDWWNVQSKKGNEGYIHISRIELIL